MRSLISSFMLVKVGSNWFNEATPRELSSSFRTEARSPTDKHGNLYATNFNDLSKWLLNKYPSKTINTLYADIRQMKSSEQKSRGDLFTYVPQSNWERYFEAIVSCSAKELKEWWDELYNLRCTVAHNGLLSKGEYDRIVKLTAKLDETLTEARVKLEKITVPADEREDAGNSGLRPNSALTNFFTEQRSLELALQACAVAAGRDTVMKSMKDIVIDLVESGTVETQIETTWKAFEEIGHQLAREPTSLEQVAIERLSVQMADLAQRVREQ